MSSGKIESLGFGGNANPFGIMFVPKVASSANEPQLSTSWDLIPDVRLYHDSEASPLYLFPQRPQPVFSEMIIWYLANTANNQAIFAAYDMYFQSGKDRPFPAINPPSSNKPYIGNDVVKLTGGMYTHGEITSASLPFGNGTPFKLICVAKGEFPQTEPVLAGNAIFLDAKLTYNPTVEHSFIQAQVRGYEGVHPGPQWTLMNIARLEDTTYNQNILNNYRIFWMSGEYYPV